MLLSMHLLVFIANYLLHAPT